MTVLYLDCDDMNLTCHNGRLCMRVDKVRVLIDPTQDKLACCRAHTTRASNASAQALWHLARSYSTTTAGRCELRKLAPIAACAARA